MGRAFAARGEPRTMECAMCHEQHGAIRRIEGMPVLYCPAVTPPGAMYFKPQPGARGFASTDIMMIVVGAEPDPNADQVDEPAEHGAAPAKITHSRPPRRAA